MTETVANTESVTTLASVDTESAVLTKDQYQVFLLDELIDGGCTVEGMVHFIMMSLPGWSDEQCSEAMKGPIMSEYSSSRKEMSMYAFSRLVQYKCSPAYADIKSAVTKWPVPDTDRYGGTKRMHRHADGDHMIVSQHPVVELR